MKALLLLFACVAFALVQAAVAQDQPPPAPAEAAPATPAAAPADDMVLYGDYTFGFELKLPVGWLVERTRFKGPANSIGLLRTAPADNHATGQILLFRTPEPVDFVDWLIEFQQSLAAISGTSKIVKDFYKVGTRDAATIAVDTNVGATPTRTLYLCVPFDGRTVWVLTLAGPARSEEEAVVVRRDFDRICETVKVLYELEDAERLTAALKRGRELLDFLRAHAKTVKPDDAERYYDIVVDGKPMGYLTRRVVRETRNLDESTKGRRMREGIGVKETSWRFHEDGTAFHTSITLFASFDQDSELMAHLHRQIPPAEAPPGGLLIRLDECVRERDVLFSSFTTNKDVSLPDPRAPIRLGEDYLGQAWLRLLPAMVPPEAREAYAFSVYDSPTRALVLHSITPAGERGLPGQPDVKGLMFELREGFSKTPSVVYTDARGNVLRLESGKVVLSGTQREKVEARWGERREAAEKRASTPPPVEGAGAERP